MLLSDYVCLTSDVWLSDVCLSHTSGISREQRALRKTKTGTEVVHVTCDLDTAFKAKRCYGCAE